MNYNPKQKYCINHYNNHLGIDIYINDTTGRLAMNIQHMRYHPIA